MLCLCNARSTCFAWAQSLRNSERRRQVLYELMHEFCMRCTIMSSVGWMQIMLHLLHICKM